MEEFARLHYDALFGDRADMNTRMSFSSDLVRAYENIHRQRVVLERCAIVAEVCGFIEGNISLQDERL